MDERRAEFVENRASPSVERLFSMGPAEERVSTWKLLQDLAHLHREYGGGALGRILTVDEGELHLTRETLEVLVGFQRDTK